MDTTVALPRIEYSDQRLANGLRVIISEDHLAPVVAVNLWYDVGSGREVQGKTGLAHLFEHMMFQGSRNVAKGEHFGFIQAGGGTLNATTWLHRTNYFETGPSNQLPLYLWLEADRMGGLLDSLGQETLDNQRDVVKNEKRQRYDNPPYGMAWPRIIDTLFPDGHPYHHPTIGSMEDLDSVTVEDCRAFFSAYYAPNNAVLSIVGDVDPSETLALAERYFGGIPAYPDIPPAPETAVADPLGGEVRREYTERVPLPRIYAAFRSPEAGTPEADALDMATSVLSANIGRDPSKSTRLYKRLVIERELAKDVGVVFQQFAGVSVTLVNATARPGASVADLEAALFETLDGLADGITDEELSRGRAVAERALVEEMVSRAAGRADALSGSATMFGDPSAVNEVLPRLLAVETPAIRSVAADVFRADNRVVHTYLPEAN